MKLNVKTMTNDNLERLNPLLLPLPWLAVGLVVTVFLAFKYTGTAVDTVDTPAAVKTFPLMFMSDVDTREFNSEGQLHYQLKTPLVHHYQIGAKPDPKDYTLFDLPQLVFLGDPKQPAWYITAKAGRSDDNGNWFTLNTDVLVQQNTASQGVVSITTEQLRINAHEQFAETDKAVTMRAAKGKMESVGMRADIKNDHIELLSNVKGTYEP